MGTKEVICTIITGDYGHYALALHDSLLKYNDSAQLAIFISKGKVSGKISEELKKRSLIVYFIEDFEVYSLANQLKSKYYDHYHDAFRWGMKPVFINFLLATYERVIYVDSDIYFFNEYQFLFEQLKECKVLLTPHWRAPFPELGPTNFKLNFLDGIYNAGFIGASRGGEEALEYWAQLCLLKCEVNRQEGFYVDQRYLDILPILFEGVQHLKHKGCNVANWNQVLCKRTMTEGGVKINNQYPIVFIHFTNTMLTGIFFENDNLLLPFLEEYRDNLLKYSERDIIEHYHSIGKYLKSRDENNFLNSNNNSVNSRSKAVKRILQKIKKGFLNMS